jgi:hypothetical protein
MAKRFTDSEKWGHEWFHKLTPTQKILWVYLCDVCDGVGKWKVNFPLASFMIGETVSWSDLEAIGLGKRIVKLSEDEVWLAGFIKFQYKTLSIKNNAHRGMMRSIVNSIGHLPLAGESLELINSFKTLLSENQKPENKDPQPGVNRGSTDPTGNGYGKGNGKGKGKGKGKEEGPDFEVEAERYLLAVRTHTSDYDALRFLGEDRKDCVAYLGGIPYLRKLDQTDSWVPKRLSKQIKDAWQTLYPTQESA